ncbi:MAG TPA: hypothetical protein PLC89_13955 [Haliscomenobacter sp.]|uniref:hypothetical protein n=1 Tax=Haliscomenobacter sp. TaxID=2717303 RepID=UPI002C21E3D2|nr:hypothetical protein [Haliscomenobacter sp.]HOY18405.1 hypothetical protein [Haliscomenobacter sp.]
MKNFKMRLRRRAVHKNAQIKEAVHASIQPSKEVPSVNNTDQENADRINAHDLFSHYTADIIKEDTIFAR